jgi:hypothetical protein
MREPTTIARCTNAGGGLDHELAAFDQVILSEVCDAKNLSGYADKRDSSLR